MSGGPSAVGSRGAGAFGELVLREADDGHVEVISNGMFLMDTRDGRSERGLVDRAVASHHGSGLHVLVGGLGVGFSVAAALASEAVARVTVVEIEPAVVELVRRVTGPRLGADLELVEVVVGDLHEVLAGGGLPPVDVCCLDVDNGPGWTLGAGNDRLYTDAGVDLLVDALAPDGVLAVWSAHDAPAFDQLLRRRFPRVAVHTWDVSRGEPDRVWVAALSRAG